MTNFLTDTDLVTCACCGRETLWRDAKNWAVSYKDIKPVCYCDAPLCQRRFRNFSPVPRPVAGRGVWPDGVTVSMPVRGESLREDLAEYVHEARSGLVRYLFEHSYQREQDGTFCICHGLSERWRRQMTTPYAALSPEEQDSDRAEADRILKIVLEAMERLTRP